MLSKFEQLKDRRIRMDRLITKAKSKLDRVNAMIKKHSAEMEPAKSAEITESIKSFLAVLDGMHRMVAESK